MNQYEKTAADGSALPETPGADARAPGVDWTSDWFPRLYEELRVLAHAQRRRFRDPSAPGTTSIVHEAFERLNRAPTGEPEHTLHFYRTAAKAMRSVLIDNARRARAAIHGGDLKRLPAEALEMVSAQRSEELLALDEALGRLGEADPFLGELVQIRVFGGLTVDELAELFEVSAPTIKRRWKTACAWLFAELEPAQ
jgi:RNA polymerase sigma factor (TIGR02999 family)